MKNWNWYRWSLCLQVGKLKFLDDFVVPKTNTSNLTVSSWIVLAIIPLLCTFVNYNYLIHIFCTYSRLILYHVILHHLYTKRDALLSLRTLCKLQHAITIAFSGARPIGVMNTLNLFDRIPNAFTTMQRARLSR